jgi:hypothetical protein
LKAIRENDESCFDTGYFDCGRGHCRAGHVCLRLPGGTPAGSDQCRTSIAGCNDCSCMTEAIVVHGASIGGCSCVADGEALTVTCTG